MFQNKRVLAFIPARIGSKGVPKKNLRSIAGLPLFMWSVLYAKSSKYVDDILVSSDSPKILKIAHENGCIQNALRPAELATDTARNIDAILWELEQLPQKYDVLIQLQPTYPIRPRGELDLMIEKYFEKSTSLITAIKINTHPEFLRWINEASNLQKVINVTSDIRRQQLNQCYQIVGSVYINNVQTLSAHTVLNENEVPYIIEDRYALDIDTLDDWLELEQRSKELLEA